MHLIMKSEIESFEYSGTIHGESWNYSGNSRLSSDKESLNAELPEASSIIPYSACLVDRSGRQFVCFHEKCMEHHNCFKNELPDDISSFQALYFHPDDKALFYEKIFPDILKFMEEIPVDEHSDYRLSFNHRYICKDGTISQFLQEGTLSMCKEDGGLPILNLRVFTEIGDFKTDETMILSIFRYFADQGYQKIMTKVYGNNNSLQLSQREIEIIKLCHEGLSSKMIANKLNLSVHTVKNHKRNCMEKTLTHNITELIHLCMRSHLL
jgi:DNA-binding CsgD family transcriptional regulator